MRSLLLLGAYKNNEWETLAEIPESKQDLKKGIQESFENAFGEGWSFKWTIR